MDGPQQHHDDADKTRLVKAAEDFLISTKNFNGDPLARLALTKKADNLRYFAEDGTGALYRVNESVHFIGAMNVLHATKTFERIPKDGTITAKELADAANVDESVIQRALRLVAAQGIATEVSPNVYSHNGKSLAFALGNGKWFYMCVMDLEFVFNKLPKYFESHSTQDIRDLRKSPYAYAHNLEGKTYYEVISADPERFEMFNKTLAEMNNAMPVLGMFPFADLKAEVEAEPDRPFIVDIGGGTGTVLNSIQKEAPAGFGARLILQDRPDVINAIPDESIPNVVKMAHDFFTPQPVKNAHIYLFRRVLHDFYDSVCVDLLKNVAVAMGPKSRLLIGDFVVPENVNIGDDLQIYWMDFCMMALTGKEKTAKQFEAILDAAGLQLIKIWSYYFGAQAMVEAKLKT